MTQIGLRQASMGLGPVFLKEEVDAAIHKIGESVMTNFTAKPPTIGAPSLGQIPPVTPQPVGEQVEEKHEKKPVEANDAKDQDPT